MYRMDISSSVDKSGYDNIEISVDGSVDWNRARQMKQNGASIFVGGTRGLFKTGLSLDESIVRFKESIS